MPQDLDTGVGSSVSTRGIVRFTTDLAHFPTSTQVVSPSVLDTGTGTTVTQRANVFDEFGRPVTVSSTGSSFTTGSAGPA